MKFIIGIVFFSFTLNALGQQDSGSITKPEVSNLPAKDTLKPFQWIQHLNYSYMPVDDTSAPFYSTSGFARNKLSGDEKVYYKDGKIFAEIRRSNGKRNGLGKLYYENGTIMKEIQYTKDEINGILKQYYPNGKIFSETTYNNGVKGATKTYDENGNETK